MNEAGDEFTDDRLIASLAANRGRSPQELIDGVIKDVRAFCGEATQSDDLTILGVHFSG
jgi:sigma-B regulation protein RsbU (phosphoserine phosphatase)